MHRRRTILTGVLAALLTYVALVLWINWLFGFVGIGGIVVQVIAFLLAVGIGFGTYESLQRPRETRTNGMLSLYSLPEVVMVLFGALLTLTGVALVMMWRMGMA